MFGATPGRLPTAIDGEVAGVTLPTGRHVRADGGEGVVVAWISVDLLSADELNDLIPRLAAVFPDTGLWPLQARGLDRGNLDRPWASGEMDGPVGEIPDVLPVLTRRLPAGPDVAAVAALAPPVPGPDMPAGQPLTVDAAGLMLVPVSRPADVPAALGWQGAMNYGYSGADHTAVLRSWEDRFGAVVLSLGFDTMRVWVARGPETVDQIEGVLREHFAYCPDNIDYPIDADT